MYPSVGVQEMSTMPNTHNLRVVALPLMILRITERHCHVNCDGYTEVMPQTIEYYTFWLVPKEALVSFATSRCLMFPRR